MANNNFPDGLNIQPLVPKGNDDLKKAFSCDAQERAIERYGIAGRIWEAAELMTRYFDLSLSAPDRLDPPCSVFSQDSTGTPAPIVLELGSGTGYVGLKLAQLLDAQGQRTAKVILTDLPEVCPLLEENLNNERIDWDENDPDRVDVLPLPWGDAQAASALSQSLCAGFAEIDNDISDHRRLAQIICSDLVYFPHLLAPLLRSLLQLTSPPLGTSEYGPEIYISYKVRSLSKETSFWAAFGLWFLFSPVLIRGQSGVETLPQEEDGKQENLAENCSDSWRVLRADNGEGSVFIARRKPDSYSWTIPDDDKDLLNGVGALGTADVKNDDTFESMLLMNMSANI